MYIKLHVVNDYKGNLFVNDIFNVINKDQTINKYVNIIKNNNNDYFVYFDTESNNLNFSDVFKKINIKYLRYIKINKIKCLMKEK